MSEKHEKYHEENPESVDWIDRGKEEDEGFA